MSELSTETGGVYRPERAELVRSTYLRYKNIAIRYWWIVAITLSIGISYQAWESLTKPTIYQSSGRMIVSGRMALPEGNMFSEETMNFFGTQVELMQSAEVARRAAARVQSLRPDLTPVPVNISVAQIPRTSIFVLTAAGSQPDYVRAFLDAVMEEYIALRQGMFAEKSQSTLTAITDQLVKLENELRRNEQELFAWQQDNNLVFLQEEGNSAGSYLATLNRTLAQLETEYFLLDELSLDQTLDRATAELGNGNPSDESPSEGESQSEVNVEALLGGPSKDYLQARRELLLLEASYQQMLGTLKPQHDKMQALITDIEQQRKLLGILREQSINQLKERRDALAVEVKKTRELIQEWEKKALDLSKRIGQFERLQSKVDRQKGLYEKLLSSVQSVDISANVQQDVVSIMEYASAPGVRITPIARDIGLGAAAGLAVGLFVLFLLGLLDDRIVSIVELQAAFDEEVVGVLPRLPESQSPIIQANDTRQPLLEAYRNLRSWLFYTPWEGAHPKTILVTSAIPKEGKSSIATNLALSLASSGAKTLLVDADLRRGILHRTMNAFAEPGMGEILTSEIEPEQAIARTEHANLWLIPKGHFESHTNDIIFGKAVDHLIQQVTADYDYIVFDSSPVLAVDDTSSLAPKMDVVLMVVRAGFTGVRLAKKSLSVLEARHANVEGIVYDSVEWTSSDYPYYRYEYESTPRETRT